MGGLVVAEIPNTRIILELKKYLWKKRMKIINYQCKI